MSTRSALAPTRSVTALRRPFRVPRTRALSHARSLAVDAELVASAPELVDRTRDRIVQATVQRQEFIRAERRVHVHSQVGNGLAPRPL